MIRAGLISMALHTGVAVALVGDFSTLPVEKTETLEISVVPILGTSAPVIVKSSQRGPLAKSQQQKTKATPQLMAKPSELNVSITDARYPKRSQARGEQGIVKLQVKVLPNSKMKFIKWIQPSPYVDLNRAALEMIKDAKLSDGAQIDRAYTKTLTVNFSLN